MDGGQHLYFSVVVDVFFFLIAVGRMLERFRKLLLFVLGTPKLETRVLYEVQVGMQVYWELPINESRLPPVNSEWFGISNEPCLYCAVEDGLLGPKKL